MNALFAQAGRNQDAEVGAALGGMMIAIVLVVLIVVLAIAICYLLTLSKALSRCSPENRTMEPGMVWLNLIPIWNIVWQFITVSRVSESLKNEFASRGRRGGGDYGKNLGLTYCIANLLGWVPILGIIASLVGLVCFIMFWVKIAGYSGELARMGPGGDFDDEEDDRPRRSRRDEGDEEEEEERPRKPKKRDDNW
jgi:hypothetical protein